jgi:hypothetical protein
MKNWQKGIIVALVHVVLVLSLGAKLLYDRAHRPRVWVRTASVDPDLPIRGRYFTLSLEVKAPDFPAKQPEEKDLSATVVRPQRPVPDYFNDEVELMVVNGELVAHKTEKNTHMSLWKRPWGERQAFLLIPTLAFFIPEHAETPHLNRGDELWAEVTIPHKGPPRPIQLAIKSGTRWTPLSYR